MYSNIPIIETRHILEDIMEHNLINPQTKEHLTSYDIITEQNYLISSSSSSNNNNNNNNNNIIIQNDRLVMGAPSSSILSEVYFTTPRKLTYCIPNTKT